MKRKQKVVKKQPFANGVKIPLPFFHAVSLPDFIRHSIIKKFEAGFKTANVGTGLSLIIHHIFLCTENWGKASIIPLSQTV
ncbi:MAG: hypothetical protein JXX29_03430, partial [Deltaproteobacteria bacterium]|nr:hypothetical protein [Deltaproteobacteria bacterium]MBN2670694.1 hypothetical protein [Deltaproteobacteria bacterium]